MHAGFVGLLPQRARKKDAACVALKTTGEQLSEGAVLRVKGRNGGTTLIRKRHARSELTRARPQSFRQAIENCMGGPHAQAWPRRKSCNTRLRRETRSNSVVTAVTAAVLRWRRLRRLNYTRACESTHSLSQSPTPPAGSKHATIVEYNGLEKLSLL